MTDHIHSFKTDIELTDADAVKERLELCLLTQKGSISADPNFGFDIAGIIDEHISSELIFSTKAKLEALITEHFPEIALLDVTFAKPYTGTLQIKLTIRILPYDKVSTISTTYTGD